MALSEKSFRAIVDATGLPIGKKAEAALRVDLDSLADKWKETATKRGERQGQLKPGDAARELRRLEKRVLKMMRDTGHGSSPTSELSPWLQAANVHVGPGPDGSHPLSRAVGGLEALSRLCSVAAVFAEAKRRPSSDRRSQQPGEPWRNPFNPGGFEVTPSGLVRLLALTFMERFGCQFGVSRNRLSKTPDGPGVRFVKAFFVAVDDKIEPEVIRKIWRDFLKKTDAGAKPPANFSVVPVLTS